MYHAPLVMNATTSVGLVQSVLRTVTHREWKADLLVFLAYLGGAKLAQYILYTLDTSPAFIVITVGIALAAVLIKGNRMWVPICAALIIATLTSPSGLPLLNKAITVVGYTLQPLIGAYIAQRMGSNGSLHRVKDVMILLTVTLCASAIGPLFNTGGQVLLGTLSATTLVTFTRSWVGGALSIIVLTPLIVGWYHSPTWPFRKGQNAEAAAAFGFLTLAIYSLFWISIPSLVFLFIFFLCAVLFWIASRFGSRVMTTSILYLTVLGILGSIIASPGETPLNTQLFADELFIILLAPIFYQFFVMAEERRQAEIRLKTKVGELENLTHQLAANDEAKNEFIAILAHELRNPLSTVVSTFEVLKLENLEAEASQLVRRAEQQTNGMRRLLDDLLDVARITEKKFAIIPEPIDLKTVIEHSVETTATLRESKKHSIRVWVPEQPVRMMADPIRLEQVITNLLNNAAKYSKPASTIEVLSSVDGNQVRIAIKDTGDGIPPERLEEIFSPFQQLVPAAHRSSGIGIGLFLARQIVEMHGGTITATSAGLGSGSTFTILLPLTPVVAVYSQKDTAREKVATKAKRVLVVDDNEAAAAGMGRLLDHHGHTVRSAFDGRGALEALEDFEPDVVLMDIGLPDMSGHDVARKIRALGGVQPVLIALTGFGQESDKNEAVVSGFNHHLTKPVSIAEVIEIINQL